MRNIIAVSTAFAVLALASGFTPAASAQTRVETHPALIGMASGARDTAIRTETKSDEMLKPYREARLAPETEPKPDHGVKTDRGPLDHPANASGESNRHE